MMRCWDDVVARVRGLASRLIGRPALEQLATSRDLTTFVEGLGSSAYRSLADIDTPSARTVERQARRVAAGNTQIIVAWSADRAEALAPLFEDEDRRNLRSLTRGIVANQQPDERAAGLLPTPALPIAALDELAHSVRLADLAATLSAWGNPYGHAMMAEAVRETPNLFALHLAVDREYAKRAVAMAPRAGDQFVRYVRLVIDAENVSTLLAVATGTVEHDAASLFIAGGDIVSRDVFAELAGLPIKDATSRLTPVLAGTPLAGLVPLARATSDSREAAMLTSLLRTLRGTVRRNPLSSAVILEYVLALRAELHDLSRVVWGISLGVPARRIVKGFVTP